MKRQTPPTLESKIILVQGSIPEMQKSLDSRVYFDQNGVLCQRLGIDQVPARVERRSRRSLPEGGIYSGRGGQKMLKPACGC